MAETPDLNDYHTVFRADGTPAWKTPAPEVLEALDRLTQAVLDYTAEDAHEKVREDAQIVRTALHPATGDGENREASTQIYYRLTHADGRERYDNSPAILRTLAANGDKLHLLVTTTQISRSGWTEIDL